MEQQNTFNAGQMFCNSLGNLLDHVCAILYARVQTDEQRTAIHTVMRFEIFRGYNDTLISLHTAYAEGTEARTGGFDDCFCKIFSGIEGRVKTVIDALYIGENIREAKDVAFHMVWHERQSLWDMIVTRIRDEHEIPEFLNV